jgi:hypothetical protein
VEGKCAYLRKANSSNSVLAPCNDLARVEHMRAGSGCHGASEECEAVGGGRETAARG